MRLIGGEMLFWSDLDGTHGPGPVRGAAAAALIAASARGRTLVAGPHDPALIDAVPPGDLTLLVRGVPDAQSLARRYAARPDVTVLCGSPEKLDGTYDTVIALAGPDRLPSVEGADLTPGDVLELLAGVTAPGGRLLLGIENGIGLHRLTALPGAPTDSDWLDHRGDRLPIEATSRYAAWPSPLAPEALLSPGLLADEDVRGWVEALLTRVCTPVTDVLSDPARLAVQSVRHGAAVTLAPGWFVVADRAPREPLPAGLTGDGPVDTDRLPRGRTLEDHLTEACARRDMPAVRTLLAAWQSDATADVPAEYVLVEPGHPLRHLAGRLLRDGHAGAFAAPRDEGDLAVTLAAMTGREIPPPPPAGPRAAIVADLIAERDRLARLLAGARAGSDRTAAELTEARRQIRVLSGSPVALALAAVRRLTRRR